MILNTRLKDYLFTNYYFKFITLEEGGGQLAENGSFLLHVDSRDQTQVVRLRRLGGSIFTCRATAGKPPC